MKKDFLKAVEDRRTYYGISKEGVIPDSEVIEIINHSVKYAPSAFHSQGARVVALFGEHHEKLWNMIKEALRKIVPAEYFAETEGKIDSFKNGHGTILYFEDSSVVESLQSQFPTYKDNFPIWSQQSSGMLQYIIWTALEAEGIGVSLQHYGEVVEAEVKKEWDIPDNWKFIAQMPFGKPIADPGEKEFQSLESRVKVYQ